MRPSCALAIAGAFIFVSGISGASNDPYAVAGASAPVALSSAVLAGSATEAALLAAEPFLSPVRAKETDIVSGFGMRDVMVQSRPPAQQPGRAPPPVGGTLQQKWEMHEGIDYSVAPGKEVRAARSGKVIFAGFSKTYVSRNDKNEQHRLVIVRHADGKSSRYVHLSALRVRPGQEVKAGQVLGVVAESDEWTETVLHFEIRTVQGQPIDPETVITEPPAP